MSRHQNIRNLDLDDELDDFDGADYDDEEEQLSPEDQEQMRIGTIAVRKQLPKGSSHITEQQIQEALWHYYYDTEKSVGFLVNKYMVKPKEKESKKDKKVESKCFSSFVDFYADAGFGTNGGVDSKTEFGRGSLTADRRAIVVSPPGSSSNSFSIEEFFKDMPWLNVQHERQANFLAPLRPRGGLLGGASEGAPKMSKLQALAAARKKKSQEQKSNESPTIEKPMASLKINDDQHTEIRSSSSILEEKASAQKFISRAFPLRKRKDSNPHERSPKALPVEREPEPIPTPPETPAIDQAAPSAFANTMFSNPAQTSSSQSHSNIFTLPYTAASASTPSDPFAGPSPDDVVIAAQSKAAKKVAKGEPKTNAEKRADQIANGMEAVKLDDTPKAKSKNLDVLKEFEKAKAKNAANFVVIGHVDAGKSTLMGRLLYDLKVVDQRTIDRYRKEAEKMGKSSFALAWVLDQGSEERARGVTIDIATNKFETEKTAFTILDAPGHRDFIPNMIAGAAQADFAVLVVDASTGSFESGLKGQTKEHALLARSMGVQRIIIAVNKLDTVHWEQERFTEIEQQISSFLTTAGFQSKNITFIPCSGLLGDNIARRSTETSASWYKGRTLVEELDISEPVSRALTKPLRITIGDIFRGGIQNPLSISGRLESGSLQVADALLAQPSGQKCFIKGLEIDNEAVDWAVAGQNVTIHLSGIEEQYLAIGDVLCSPASPIQNIKRFTAKMLAFEFLTPMQVDIHRGRLHTPGRIAEITAVLDKGSGAPLGKKKPRIVKPGQVARVVIEMDSAVPLEAPGRVVLRSSGSTVAAGLLE